MEIAIYLSNLLYYQNMIKAVIFDAGGVIHYRDGKTLRPITDFLKKKGYNISPDKLKKAYDEDVLSAYKGKILSWFFWFSCPWW